MKYLDKNGLEYAWKKIQTYLDKKTNNADLLDKIYPVGSIYLTMGDKSPADLFGGTWKKLSGGYLYANSSNPGGTGGGHTISITTANLPSHTHSIPSHTHSIPSHTHSIPSHNHGYTRADSVGYHSITWNELTSHTHGFINMTDTKSDGGTNYGLPDNTAGYKGRVMVSFDGTKQTDSAGGGASHNHGLTSSWQSSGNWNGTTGSAGNGNTGQTGGTSGATGSGTAITFYPEYINVYMWQRTA